MPKVKIAYIDTHEQAEASTDEAVAETFESVASFCDDIANGDFDPFLRMIARACFKRRDTIYGTNLVSHPTINVEGETQADDPALADADSISAAATAAVGGDAGYLAPRGVPKFQGRIPNGKTGDFIVWKGARYSRNDVIGKTFYWPWTTKAMHGVRCRVIGLGNDAAKITIESRPNTSQGQYMSAYQQQQAIFVRKQAFCEMFFESA